jgi:acyl carrier protein
VPTVPGTTYLEMARAALASLNGDGWRRSELRDVVFLAPMAVPPGEAREVLTLLEARGAGAWGFRVASRPEPPAGGVPDAAWQEHARGEIVPGAAAAEEPGAAHLVDLSEPSPAEGGREVDLLAVRDGGLLRTGPRWHSLRRLVVGAGRGTASLELAPELAAELDAYPLHPALLDLAAGAVRLAVEGSFLPLAYQRLRLLAPFPPSCRSHFRLREGDGDLLTADVTVVDPRGGRVVEIEGFTMRRLGAAAVAQLHAGREIPGAAPPVAIDLAPPLAPGGRPAGTAGILPAEGAEIFRRILGLDAAVHAPHRVISTAPLEAVVAATDALDRDALAARRAPAGAAAPAGARPALGNAYAAPDGELERLVAEAWEKVLGIAEIGVHDNFFELGGSSLSAIQLVSELRQRLGVELPSVSVFEAPTIHRLMGYLRPLRGEPTLAERGRGRAEKKRAALAVQQRTAAVRMPREGRGSWQTTR